MAHGTNLERFITDGVAALGQHQGHIPNRGKGGFACEPGGSDRRSRAPGEVDAQGLPVVSPWPSRPGVGPGWKTKLGGSPLTPYRVRSVGYLFSLALVVFWVVVNV